MRRARLLIAAAALIGLAACRDEARRSSHRPPDAPVASFNAIPDAPVNGILRGAPFVLRDARYIIDRRVGYAHTDIKLSAGKADTPCGPIAPARSASVWLRFEGEPMTAKDFRLAAGDEGPWSVHYQIFEAERWIGVGEGTAVVSIREPGPDGRLSGGIGVCFADDKKSCVSGSFEAQNCPASIDQPVRGALPPEAVPPRYRLQMFDAGSAPDSSVPSLAPPGSARIPPPH